MDQHLIKESRIITTLLNLNRNLLVFFYNSKICKVFAGSSAFLKDVISRYAGGSLIIERVKKTLNIIDVKDIGLFIVLVVIFNTLAMAYIGMVIDIFSKVARVAFLILGISMIWFKRQK